MAKVYINSAGTWQNTWGGGIVPQRVTVVGHAMVAVQTATDVHRHVTIAQMVV